MSDAQFEDASWRPLRLRAEAQEDLEVLSSLVQDAVFPVSEISWQPSARRFAALINRFRWEDLEAAKRHKRPYERVQTVLQFDDVLSVRSHGIDRTPSDKVLSLLSISYRETRDGGGQISLALAGGGTFQLTVEAINATLQDVTVPYLAPSGKAPHHPE